LCHGQEKFHCFSQHKKVAKIKYTPVAQKMAIVHAISKQHTRLLATKEPSQRILLFVKKRFLTKRDEGGCLTGCSDAFLTFEVAQGDALAIVGWLLVKGYYHVQQ
jgi:hypothetical protein